MDSSRPAVSPGLEEFLAKILDKPSPGATAAFCAAILDECHPADAAAFAAAILHEYHFDPKQPRDWRGRWTVGAPHEKSDEERRREVDKALAPAHATPGNDRDARADDNSIVFGKRTFISNDGKALQARFSGFDASGRVLLERASDGRKFAVPLKRFSEKDKGSLEKLHQDKGFMAGLTAKPRTVHLDSSGVKRADPLAWEAQVVRDIGKLSELETGRAVLDAAQRVGKEITIKLQSSGDNHARGGVVYYDPGRTVGARAQSGSRERPPFIGLGQELSNAVVNLADPNRSLYKKEEGGLRVGQELRVEYNETIRDETRRKEFTQRYPATPTGYPGWGTKIVDERVLGLNGRPLPRRRRDR